jgi:hypothetical protein
MPRTDNVMELPKDLPVPQDDGACSHLTGIKLPSVALASTRGRKVDLSQLKGTTVVYIYPRTGRPDQEVPAGWNAIPGARGCTPQSCGFRDHYAELTKLGAAEVFGLSTQDSAYQQEVAVRAVERRETRIRARAQAADFCGRRHDADQAHHADRARR